MGDGRENNRVVRLRLGRGLLLLENSRVVCLRLGKVLLFLGKSRGVRLRLGRCGLDWGNLIFLGLNLDRGTES